jgi:hypothetical protein
MLDVLNAALRAAGDAGFVGGAGHGWSHGRHNSFVKHAGNDVIYAEMIIGNGVGDLISKSVS